MPLASAHRFSQLVENTPDMVYRYRLLPEPGFEYINRSCIAITGYNQEEHYADPYLGMKIIHPDDKGLLEAYFNDPEQIRQALVLRWIRKDGKQIWTEQFNTPIVDDTGRVVAFEGVARDITDLVTTQERLKASKERQEIHFNELQHRIKNSFLMIDGLFELEADMIGSDHAADMLRKMQARVKSIASLYSMLRITDSLSKIPVDAYCRTLIDSLVMDRAEKELNLESVEIPAHLVAPIGIIINEMVTNSLKHAFAGGRMGKIVMSLTKLDDTTIRLRIGDNGPGFPPGFTPAQSTGLGTQLIEMLSMQLGAEPKWSSEGGLSLELMIPI